MKLNYPLKDQMLNKVSGGMLGWREIVGISVGAFVGTVVAVTSVVIIALVIYIKKHAKKGEPAVLVFNAGGFNEPLTITVSPSNSPRDPSEPLNAGH